MSLLKPSASARFSLIAAALSLCLLLGAPAQAQDTTVRDPFVLALQLLGWDGQPAIPPPSPLYRAGDSEVFWVSRANADEPVQIKATLAAASANVYLWVEEGLTFDPAAMSAMAGQTGLIFDILRIRGNTGAVNVVPETADQTELLATWRLPDVDNDPHLYVLYVKDLNGGQNSLFNPVNSLEKPLAPGGYSNQHEMVILNTANFPGVPLDNATYTGVLARQLYGMIAYYNNPAQAAWLREALGWYMLLQIQQRDIGQGDIAPYINAPETPLTRLPTLTSSGQEFGAAQLFLRYLQQRFGSGFFIDLFTTPGNGLSALDTVLTSRGITDLETGEPITARDVFADFVMANVLNARIGDGRFIHTTEAARNQLAPAVTLQDQFNFATPTQTVNQLASRYYLLTTTQAVSFSLAFDGQPTNIRLPMPASDSRGRFYWSGAGPDRHAVLTRTFDLRNLTEATLTFDAWYSLVEGWNYAYVQVSTDGGATWTPLPATITTTVNPYAAAYGPGFSGISNPRGPRPFPYLGIGLDANGVTITSIVPDGPLANTEIQAGDTIAGYDGERWAGQPNLLAFLSNYEPGDTVNLLIERGSRTFDAPVTLGEHPTRRIIPDPIWTAQTVDLNAYAGKQISLRFSSISLPETDDLGFALDNIAIPQLNFLDDAESSVQGWTLAGWQQTDNQIAQRYVVQTAVMAADLSGGRVQRLIAPADTAASGSWDFSLQPGEILVIAVSGLNDDTITPAQYILSVTTETSSQ